MNLNVGNRDRMSRALVGVALLIFAVGGPFNTMLSAIIGVVGVVAVATAVVGFCPAYSLLRMSTLGKGKRGG
jgi:hypothetical protein